MEDLKLLDEVKPEDKVYNEKKVTLGAFLGGPLAAGYMLIENYKALGQSEKINKAWAITIISSTLFFALAIMIPENIKVPNIVFSIVCVVAARQIFKQYQESDVEKHLERGGELQSNWRVAGVSLVMFLIAVGIFIGGFMLLGEEEVATLFPVTETELGSDTSENSDVSNVEIKSYGDVAHVIVYNKSLFSEAEIDAIASKLAALDFFDSKNQKNVYLEKKGSDYEFAITDVSADINDNQTNMKYKALRAELETFLKDGRVIVLLFDDDYGEVLGRFE